jgi:hypothetical protein
MMINNNMTEAINGMNDGSITCKCTIGDCGIHN